MHFYETRVTERLVLRKPRLEDAEAIFHRFACDSEVTRFVSWPRPQSLDDTISFLKFSDSEWDRWSVGPFLVFAKKDGQLLGSTGLYFESPTDAVTGYVFARDAWGKGFASETLRAMVELTQALNLPSLSAYTHVDHSMSMRVLTKCGFNEIALIKNDTVFPNLIPPNSDPMDVRKFERRFGS